MLKQSKINRALTGAALSLGTNIEIIDIPGYAPLVNDENMITLAKDAAKLLGIDLPVSSEYSTGSTDMGDLSTILPVVHPYAGGSAGTSHGNDYQIADPEAACITNAKWQLIMLTLLLEKGGERAKKVMAEFKPLFASKEEFLAFQDSLCAEGDRITYRDDGVAEVRI